jgi:DNA-directed RNA polymerase specialized sigma24 family protein
MSYDEIAQLTETSTSTAHRRYEAGMAELRRRLGAANGLRRS